MPPETQEYSNNISVGKFIFYSIVSLGIYEIVWVYRNWKFFKEKEDLNISPFWRAIFAIFFINSLFKKMLKLSQEKNYKETYSSGWLTAFWFILALLSRLPDPYWLISISTFIPLLGPLNAINYYWEKSGTKLPERKLKWWHILLVIVGILIWILIFYEMFFSEI